MKRAFRIILRILTPAVCILTALSLLLPVISLEGLHKNVFDSSAVTSGGEKYLTGSLSASETAAKPDSGAFEICKDGKLSSVDLIRLYPGSDKEKDASFPEFYRKLFLSVRRFFVPLVIVMSGMLLLLLLTALFSLLSGKRGPAITGFVLSLLNSLLTVGYMLVLSFAVSDMRVGSAPVLTGMIVLTVSGVGFALVLSGAALLICRRQDGVPEDVTVLTGYVGRTNAPEGEEKPSVCCLTGESMGLIVPVKSTEPLVIGRTGEEANLVIPSESVSRRHCTIVYDEYRRMYAVTDCSQNGTYTEKGYRLLKGYASLFPDGTVLYLSNSENAVRLGHG